MLLMELVLEMTYLLGVQSNLRTEDTLGLQPLSSLRKVKFVMILIIVTRMAYNGQGIYLVNVL